jgi:hypothetical protein
MAHGSWLMGHGMPSSRASLSTLQSYENKPLLQLQPQLLLPLPQLLPPLRMPRKYTGVYYKAMRPKGQRAAPWGWSPGEELGMPPPPCLLCSPQQQDYRGFGPPSKPRWEPWWEPCNGSLGGSSGREALVGPLVGALVGALVGKPW